MLLLLLLLLSASGSINVSLSLRVVKAGSELTWKYSTDNKSQLEVPCLCVSNGCQGHFSIGEELCDVCEVKGQGETQ